MPDASASTHPLLRSKLWPKLLVLAIAGLMLFPFLAPIVLDMAWVGTKAVRFRFEVIDAASGQPIENAALRFFQADAREKFVEKEHLSDAEGHIESIERCTTMGRSGLLTDTSFVAIPEWMIEVHADGYSPSEPELLGHRTGSSMTAAHPDPPLVRFALRREPTPGPR